MCREMCREMVVGWDFGGQDFTVVSAFYPKTNGFEVIWLSERASGLTDFVSAITPPKNPENSAFCPSCGAECVAKCGANPAGGPA